MSGPGEIVDAGTGRGGLRRLLVPIGIVAGCAVYWALARAFGAPVEVWDGVFTFTNPRWVANVALTPAVAGFVTGFITGEHGKWYGMVPVTVVHTADYFALVGGQNPEVHVLGFPLFVFFMLVMLELGLMAGWGAEILRHRMGGRNVRA